MPDMLLRACMQTHGLHVAVQGGLACTCRHRRICDAHPLNFLRMALTTSLTPRLICLRLEARLASFSTFLASFSSARGSAMGIRKGPVFCATAGLASTCSTLCM